MTIIFDNGWAAVFWFLTGMFATLIAAGMALLVASYRAYRRGKVSA